jgi:hypothetical protein
MLRPQEQRINSSILCRDCGKLAKTQYICEYLKDGNTLESTAIRCVCGYRYGSSSVYGKGKI